MWRQQPAEYKLKVLLWCSRPLSFPTAVVPAYLPQGCHGTGTSSPPSVPGHAFLLRGAPSWGEKLVQPSACQPQGLWVSTQRLYCRVWFFSCCPFTQSYSGYRGLARESFCLHFKAPCLFTALYQPGRGITFQLDMRKIWSMLHVRRKEDKPLDKVGETQMYGVFRESFKKHEQQ